MSDGKVVFEITADGKKAVASVKDITSAIQSESKKWETATQNSTLKIENSLAQMAKKVVAGFSAMQVAKSLLDFGSAAVSAASDLAEVQNVVDTTFGDSANQIETWSKKAIKQFGLTETKAKQFTSTLGAMFKSAGMNGDSIVEMSTDLAGLAADMSSFYNLDFDTAFQKIRSGISGETEPLKQLGINMSVANLEAYALSKGITKAFNSMSQSEQIMLRYQYLMDATADAQGDFEKTSDGLANGLRLLQSNFESIKTTLGSAFLGVVEDAVGGLNGLLSLLVPDPNSKTVLDEFAEIDLKTEEKLKSVEATATKARELTSLLAEMDSTAVATGKSLAEDLSNIKIEDSQKKSVEDLNKELEKIKDAVPKEADINTDGIQKINTYADGTKKAVNDANKALEEVPNKVPQDNGNLTGGFDKIAEAADGVEVSTTDAKSALKEIPDAVPKDTSGLTEGIEKIAEAADGVEISSTDAKTALKAIPDGIPKTADTGGIEKITEATDNLEISSTEAKSSLKGIPESVPKSASTGAIEKITEATDNLEVSSTDAKSSLKTIPDAVPKDSNGLTGGLGIIADAADGIEISATEAKSSLKTLPDAVPKEADISNNGFDAIDVAATDTTSIVNETGKSLEELPKQLPDKSKVKTDGIDKATDSLNNLVVQTRNASGEITGISTQLTEGHLLEKFDGEEFEEAGQAIVDAVEPATEEVESITGASDEWLSVCRQLVQTIPGLSGIINTETGEIKGGIDAVNDYIDAWESLEKKRTYLSGIEQKRSALDQKFTELPGLEIDKAVAEQRVKKSYETLKALHDKYGAQFQTDQNGKAETLTYSTINLTDPQYNELEKEVKAYNELVDASHKATDAYQLQKDAYDEAAEALRQQSEEIEESITDEERAAIAADEHTKAINAAKSAYDAATEAVEEYRKKTLEATTKSVEKTIKGFETIDSESGKAAVKVSGLKAELESLGKRTEKNAKQWDKLNSEIEKYNEKIITGENMKKGLEDQLQFMREYTANLKKAQEMGLSNELLASLSDGSAESADYLAALVSDEGMAKEIDALYKDVNKEKESFISTLTDQNLAVDESYTALKEAVTSTEDTLKETAKAAKTAAEEMGQGIADGIYSKVGVVQTAVDSLNLALSSLTFGGMFGFKLDGSHEGGLNFVPFDHYLAELHAGEGILTAEENRIWQNFKNGGLSSANTIDYDALGGVMRDNVHAGGNVYLDGNSVGRVISQQQGQSYRALQRSGWQQ